MEQNASTAPNFNPQTTGVVGNLLSGGGQDYSGILNSGYDAYKSQLNPYASGSMVGNNTALRGLLDTIANDVRNNVGSTFAAAGRPIGTNAAGDQAMARGIAQGEAPVIAGQYNQDVANQLGAAGNLFNAAGGTAGGLSTLNQTRIGNQTTGLGAASALPGILNANPQALLAAGGLEQSLPLSGAGLLESLGLPIASLGAQSTGTSTGTTTQQQPLAQTVLGGLLGGAGLLGGTGAFGGSGWLTKLIGSDERIKEDIEPVGILNDGSNIYRYRYKADPSGRTHIGLMAQEVEQKTPKAVTEIGGVKFVDYDKATAPARAAGILNDLAA